MTTYYIYTLSNPTNGEIFYVGCTKNPEQRLQQHMIEDWRGNDKWMYIEKMGCIPHMNIVEQVQSLPRLTSKLPPLVAHEIELAWISKLILQGHKLTNKQKGSAYKDSITYSIY